MTNSLSAEKSELRRQLRAKIKSLPQEQRAEASTRATARLCEQTIWKTAKSILFYSPLADEIDLSPLIGGALAEKKITALPRFLSEQKIYAAFRISVIKTDCVRGKFGIIEPNENCSPIALNQLDLVLVPGVGFSRDGHRLGRGQGFYDRLLARVSATKCGIAFDEQMVEQVPAEPHDVRMNFILTPTRWLEITK